MPFILFFCTLIPQMLPRFLKQASSSYRVSKSKGTEWNSAERVVPRHEPFHPPHADGWIWSRTRNRKGEKKNRRQAKASETPASRSSLPTFGRRQASRYAPRRPSTNPGGQLAAYHRRPAASSSSPLLSSVTEQAAAKRHCHSHTVTHRSRLLSA